MELILNRSKLNHKEDNESDILLTRFVKEEIVEMVVVEKFKKADKFVLILDVFVVI